MFNNYFKIAINHILNHKLYALINILGLAVGLACTLLIGLYVLDELSYDRFFTDSDRIYRVSKDTRPSATQLTGFFPASLNAPYAPKLKEDFSQVEASARLYNFLQPIIMKENFPIQESDFMYVDNSFLTMFSFKWLQGDADSAFKGPMSIVLTKAAAAQYFANGRAFGKTLTLAYDDRQFEVTVSGVIDDLPNNTHLAIRALMPFGVLNNIFGEQLDDWRGNTDFHTYLKLAPGADLSELERGFPAFVDKYAGDNASKSIGLSLMKLTDIHLRSTRTEELKPTGSVGSVMAVAAIAVGILLIACINFMNLSTARSSRRSKEVGIRKVIGAQKSQLIQQFLAESLIMTSIAMAFALALVEVSLPWFETFTGKSFGFVWFQDQLILTGLFAVIVFVGLVAGSYPAFILSSFKASEVIKGKLMKGRDGKLFRQALVVFQFSISIALIVATAVIYAQMQYARHIDLGINKEQVVVIPGTRTRGLGTQWEAMKQELLAHSEITNVTSSNYQPFTQDANFTRVGLTPNAAERQRIKFMAVDYDFFETYGISLLAGRTFSRDRGTDRMPERGGTVPAAAGGAYIINEALAKKFGWSAQEALAHSLWQDEKTNLPIIGVTVNSNFESIAAEIEPMLFFVAPPNFRGTASLAQGAVRVTGKNIEATLKHIDTVWRRFLPDLPLNRHFLNEDFDALYAQDRQQGEMMTGFTTLAIFIACLGLYGLASFSSELRRKEIGVRKVMGGSVWSIVVLLTNDFSKLVLLSNIIAWPLAYYAMSRWLETYAYRIDLTPVVFIGSSLIALCIAWVTVVSTTAKTASAKPVLALRCE